jgi:hypothetical protein
VSVVEIPVAAGVVAAVVPPPGVAVVVSVGTAVAVPVAVVVPLALTVGEAVPVVVAVAVPVAVVVGLAVVVAVAVPVAVLVAVEVAVVVAAAATAPPRGTLNPTNATAAKTVITPPTMPNSPAVCTASHVVFLAALREFRWSNAIRSVPQAVFSDRSHRAGFLPTSAQPSPPSLNTRKSLPGPTWAFRPVNCELRSLHAEIPDTGAGAGTGTGTGQPVSRSASAPA